MYSIALVWIQTCRKNELWGNPKITPCMHVKWSSSGKDSFPVDGSGKTGHPHVEELNGPLCTDII